MYPWQSRHFTNMVGWNNLFFDPLKNTHAPDKALLQTGLQIIDPIHSIWKIIISTISTHYFTWFLTHLPCLLHCKLFKAETSWVMLQWKVLKQICPWALLYFQNNKGLLLPNIACFVKKKCAVYKLLLFCFFAVKITKPFTEFITKMCVWWKEDPRKDFLKMLLFNTLLLLVVADFSFLCWLLISFSLCVDAYMCALPPLLSGSSKPLVFTPEQAKSSWSIHRSNNRNNKDNLTWSGCEMLLDQWFQSAPAILSGQPLPAANHAVVVQN